MSEQEMKTVAVALLLGLHYKGRARLWREAAAFLAALCLAQAALILALAAGWAGR